MRRRTGVHPPAMTTIPVRMISAIWTSSCASTHRITEKGAAMRTGSAMTGIRAPTTTCDKLLCATSPVPGCCLENADCGEPDACSTVACVNNLCEVTPIANCCEDSGDCTAQGCASQERATMVSVRTNSLTTVAMRRARVMMEMCVRRIPATSIPTNASFRPSMGAWSAWRESLR